MKTILIDAINTFVIKDQGIYNEMYEMLEQYPNEKIILTNADDGEIMQFGLNKMPYKIFTMKHNPDKKDTKYFEEMLKTFDLKIDNVIYFEHNIDAVNSAQSIGIKSYLYNKELKDLISLKRFIDDNL